MILLRKPKKISNLKSRYQPKRIGRPEDIAHAALFLMNNSYVTGLTNT